MLISIGDIAIELSFSVSSVSNDQSDYPSVALETLRLAKEAARRMGHWPNVAARSLRAHSTHAIGLTSHLIDRHLTDPYYLDLLAGIGAENGCPFAHTELPLEFAHIEKPTESKILREPGLVVRESSGANKFEKGGDLWHQLATTSV